MSRRSSRGGGGDAFALRLREALSRFADGVHQLGPPAATAELPESAASVYQLADGLDLFGDVVRLRPLAAVERTPEGWLLGEAEGRRLLCAADGAIVELDEDGDRLRAADDLETALLIYVAREALLVGADGEWKEVFGDDGEIVPAVRKRRNEAGRRRAPAASRWLTEAAELALELDGDEAEAIALCAEACTHDDDAAAPAELRGVLLASRGALAEGADALAAAAERSGPTRRAERAAAAAEAAARAGDEAARARMATLARDAEPGMVERLGAEAESALAAGRTADADRLAALAMAIAGGEDALPGRVRASVKLRTLK